MLFYCHRHFRSKTLIKTDAISMSCPCSIFCTQCIFQVSIEDTWNNSGKTDAKKDLFDEKVSRSSDSQYVIEVMRGVLTVRLCFEKLTQVCKQIFSWKRIGRTMTTYRWGTRVYARKVASKHQMRQRGRCLACEEQQNRVDNDNKWGCKQARRRCLACEGKVCTVRPCHLLALTVEARPQ